MTTPKEPCPHLTLHFGSGGHYIFCNACAAAWCSRPDGDGALNAETYRQATSIVCQSGTFGQERTIKTSELAEFTKRYGDEMLARMQEPGFREKMDRAFAASPAEIGNAAVQAAQKELARAVVSEVKDDVAKYFRLIGFEVTWDFDKRTGLRWYEIYDGDEQLVQIDFGVPLAELLTELPRLAAMEEDDPARRDPKATWEVRGSLEDLRRVVARMRETPK